MKRLIVAIAMSATSLGAVAADTYVVDSRHTLPSFAIDHFGFSTTRGSFTDTRGSIVLDLAHKSGSVNITIDAASLHVAVPKLVEHLKSADFFDVAKFPTITFKSDRLGFDGDRLVSVDGDLTMHGVTRPVSLDVTRFACKAHPMTKQPHCGADAVATIKRSDWGIATYSPAIGEDVTLEIQIEANKP